MKLLGRFRQFRQRRLQFLHALELRAGELRVGADETQLSIGTAFIVVIVSEMIAVNNGLGFRILEAREYFWSDKIIAGMISQVNATTIRTLSRSVRRKSGQDASVGPSVARIAVTTAYAPAQVSSMSL